MSWRNTHYGLQIKQPGADGKQHNRMAMCLQSLDAYAFYTYFIIKFMGLAVSADTINLLIDYRIFFSTVHKLTNLYSNP